jgi:AcrR family transcriptional regulator
MFLMVDWKQWLLTSVASEYVFKDLADADIYYIAEAKGISKKDLDARFRDKKELVFSLIDTIAEDHKRYILEKVKHIHTPRERLVHFISAGLEFAEQNPALSQVIYRGLFSTDIEIRDHVYSVYEEVFRLMMSDLEEEGIVRHQTYALTSDLTTILLSAIFTGGCPQLMLEYNSWVDYYRVASSILDALTRRYQSNDLEAKLL